ASPPAARRPGWLLRRKARSLLQARPRSWSTTALKTFTLWSRRSERKAATFSTRSTTPSTASSPGSSILRETKLNCGNHLPVNDRRPYVDQAVLHRDGPADLDHVLPRAPRLPARLPRSRRRPILGRREPRWDRPHAQGRGGRRAALSQPHAAPMGPSGRAHLQPGLLPSRQERRRDTVFAIEGLSYFWRWRRSRIQSANCGSVRLPSARASIVVTTSSSVVS